MRKAAICITATPRTGGNAFARELGSGETVFVPHAVASVARVKAGTWHVAEVEASEHNGRETLQAVHLSLAASEADRDAMRDCIFDAMLRYPKLEMWNPGDVADAVGLDADKPADLVAVCGAMVGPHKDPRFVTIRVYSAAGHDLRWCLDHNTALDIIDSTPADEAA